MEAKRTLVKSPPELWAELSDVAALARHLGEFGEIRITRTQPETVVEWEGDRVSGTVQLDASGWGTRVTLTAEGTAPPAAPPPPPEPVAVERPRPSRFKRWLWWRRRPEPPESGPEPEPEPPPAEPDSSAIDDERAAAVLTAVLDSLGAAHHRPFSR